MNIQMIDDNIIDPLINKRNILLNKLDFLINDKSLLLPEVSNSYIKELETFLDEIISFDYKLNKVINLICSSYPNSIKISNSISEIIHSHYFWRISIKNLIFILNNYNQFDNNVIPDMKTVYRMKFNSQEISNDFPFFHFYKNYNIHNIVKITFFTDEFELFLQNDNLDIFDFIVLRSIFVFYANNLNKISYTNLFKYISSNNPNVVTDKQITLIRNSVLKLKKISIIINNIMTKQTHKEKLLYTIDLNEHEFLVLRDTFIYRFSTMSGLHVKLDNNAFNCPISMTKSNIYLDNLYSDLNAENNQTKKKLRDAVFRILEYWESSNVINSFEICKYNNRFTRIIIKK
ncbi:hypothetical protein J2Z72_000638 [Peptostreptococcus canis]|nr:hypothetical protein [Peptostreptococcus canis]